MINLKLVKFLLAICAALAVIMLLEWLYALYAQKQLLDSVTTLDKNKSNASVLPSIELEKRQETSYVDMVERPLFIPGRKPVKENNPANTTPVNAASDTFNWDLNGIYTQSGRLYGLFSRNGTKQPKDNFRKITKDGNIDGWQLSELTKDKAVFSQGGLQKELLLRKIKPKNPTTTPPGVNPMNIPPVPLPAGMAPGGIPNQQQPIVTPEPMPEPAQPVIEPELIPDDSSDSNFENSDEEQY